MTKSSNLKTGYSKTTTIDLIHKKKMKEFQKEERNLPKMKRRVKELAFLIDTFELLNKMGKYSNMEINAATSSILPKKGQNKTRSKKGKTAKKQSEEQQLKNFDEYYVCLDEKDNFETKISELENNTKKQEYFMEVGDLLFQYYDDEKNREISKSNSSQITKKSKKKNSILNYFARKREEQKRKKEEAESKIKQENQLINNSNDSVLISNNSTNDSTNNSDNITDDPNIKINEERNREMFKGNMRYIGKNNVITKYMRTVDPDYVVPLEYDEQHDYCQDCKCYMKTIHSEGVMRCEQCGYQEKILIDSDKPSYKDPPRELSYYNYQRVNHLIELITKCIEIIGETYIISFSSVVTNYNTSVDKLIINN